MGNPSKDHPWALSPASLGLLAERLAATRPGLALECGSGLSTEVMREHCGHVISLEHQARFAAKTAGLVTRANGAILLAEIGEVPTPIGPQPFYRAVLPDGIEFALIDGPPQSVGRGGTLFALWPHLAPGAVVWLDDAQRPGERDAVAAWTAHLPITLEQLTADLLEIRRAD